MKGASDSAVPPETKVGTNELRCDAVQAGGAGVDIGALVAGVDAVLWQARSPGGREIADGIASLLRYTYVSPQAERLFGYSLQRWLAESDFWTRCIHSEDRERVVACYEAGLCRAGGFWVDYRALHNDGSVVFVRDIVHVEPLGQGFERRVHGILVNIGDWKQTEQALREAEEQYRELVENINECVFSVNAEGWITYISPVIEDISGYPPGEVLTRHFSDFVYPGDLARLAESFEKALAGKPEPLEYRLLMKSGDVRWVRSWSRVIVYGDRIAGVRGALVDITDRRRMDAELRESQARYHQLFENANDMIYTFDAEGTLTSVNAAVEQVSGYSRRELIGMNVVQLSAPEAWELAHRMIQRKIAGMHTTYETILLTKEGARVPIEVSSRAVERDGQLLEIQGIARDLRERRRTERLAVERKRLENEVRVAAALARAGRDLMSCREPSDLIEQLCRVTTEVLECDCSHILYWQAADDTYVPVSTHGHTPEEVEAMQVIRIPRRVLTPMIERLRREDVAQVRLSESGDLLAVPFPAQFGASVVLFMLLRRGDEILGLHLASYRGRKDAFSDEQCQIARGIAQLASLALENARLVGELERANRLKSDFMATMSHELRTPLNVIIGYNQMLLDEHFGPLSSGQAEASRRVKDHATDLLNLVSATLSVGRLETGAQPISLMFTDLGDLMKEIEVEARDLCYKAGLDFTWRTDTDLPLIRTDPLKLKVVVKNLVWNAVKFTPKGSVSLSIHTHPDGVEVVVSDTGVGIPEDLRQTIFEPFYQVGGRLPESEGGVGLGLYIVRRLLELLGGSVTVESEVGRGSTFRVGLCLSPRGTAFPGG
jgi:PAS domain S-box-containing protein